jgi:hypothetical protein
MSERINVTEAFDPELRQAQKDMDTFIESRPDAETKATDILENEGTYSDAIDRAIAQDPELRRMLNMANEIRELGNAQVAVKDAEQLSRMRSDKMDKLTELLAKYEGSDSTPALESKDDIMNRIIIRTEDAPAEAPKVSEESKDDNSKDSDPDSSENSDSSEGSEESLKTEEIEKSTESSNEISDDIDLEAMNEDSKKRLAKSADEKKRQLDEAIAEAMASDEAALERISETGEKRQKEYEESVDNDPQTIADRELLEEKAKENYVGKHRADVPVDSVSRAYSSATSGREDSVDDTSALEGESQEEYEARHGITDGDLEDNSGTGADDLELLDETSDDTGAEDLELVDEQEESPAVKRTTLRQRIGGALRNPLATISAEAGASAYVKRNERGSSRRTRRAALLGGAALLVGGIWAAKHGHDIGGNGIITPHDIPSGHGSTTGAREAWDSLSQHAADATDKANPAPDVFGQPFDVEYTHGFIKEWQDWGNNHGVVLSDEKAEQLHKHLLGIFGKDGLIDLDGVKKAAETYTENGDVLIGAPGTAHWRDGVEQEAINWLQAH